MSTPRFYTMLGFAAKARALVSGETGCLQAISRGKVKLVIVARDASENTRERFVHRCRRAGVPAVLTGTKMELGAAMGKPERSCIAIADSGFAKTILESLEERVFM